MPTHPGAPTQARRQFVGFDLEVATYVRLKPELLSRFPGKFVVIVAEELGATHGGTRGHPQTEVNVTFLGRR